MVWAGAKEWLRHLLDAIHRPKAEMAQGSSTSECDGLKNIKDYTQCDTIEVVPKFSIEVICVVAKALVDDRNDREIDRGDGEYESDAR